MSDISMFEVVKPMFEVKMTPKYLDLPKSICIYQIILMMDLKRSLSGCIHNISPNQRNLRTRMCRTRSKLAVVDLSSS